MQETRAQEKETKVKLPDRLDKDQVESAWRSFQWEGVAGENNSHALKATIERLIASDLLQSVPPEGAKAVFQEIVELRGQAKALYWALFNGDESHPTLHSIARRTKFEPTYHNIDGAWLSHVDFVLNAGARIFTGMLLKQQQLRETKDSQETAVFEKFLGHGSLEHNWSYDDFISLVSVLLFHEAGEWWPKVVWKEALDVQKEELTAWQKGEKSNIRDIKEIVAELKSQKPDGEDWYHDCQQTMLTIQKYLQDALESHLLTVEYNPEVDPTELDIYFSGGDPADMVFRPYDENQTIDGQSKSAILARLFHSADFFQVFSPSYHHLVDYQAEDN